SLGPTLQGQHDLAGLPQPVSAADQEHAKRTADLPDELVKRVVRLQGNLQNAVNMPPVADDHAMTIQMWIAVISGIFFLFLLLATAIMLIFFRSVEANSRSRNVHHSSYLGSGGRDVWRGVNWHPYCHNN